MLKNHTQNLLETRGTLLLKNHTQNVLEKLFSDPYLKNQNGESLDIFRSKGNHAMKFGQLIEYITRNIFVEKSYTKSSGDTRNIFVEKSYTKCAGETIFRPLSKKSKWSMSLDQYRQVLNSLFLPYANLRAIEI